MYEFLTIFLLIGLASYYLTIFWNRVDETWVALGSLSLAILLISVAVSIS